MLPTLHLRGLLAAGPTFTRRPLWVRPLESLWSILAKWQFVNRLPFVNLARLFLSHSAAQSEQGADLRLLESFKIDALAEHSGLSADFLASAACCAGTDSRTLGLASQHFRFCAACLKEGFHAALFQFKPIRLCPIHRQRLNEACPYCHSKIPYRLDAAFAAFALCCPRCHRSLLVDPTILARQCHTSAAHDVLMRWQFFLATYVDWYADPQSLRDGAGRFLDQTKPHINPGVAKRFDFVGQLQDLLDLPPPLPTLKLAMDRALLPQSTNQNKFDKAVAETCFARALWPQFHTKRFLMLFRRYANFSGRLQELNSPAQRETTRWWRKSWEGAIARECVPPSDLMCPPLGIAEWACYAISPRHVLQQAELHITLGIRFEQDMRLTWQAWNDVVLHMGGHQFGALHPYLVPPRACWLSSPAFAPGSPALGFF